MAEHSIDFDDGAFDDPVTYDIFNAQSDPATRLPDHFWNQLSVDGKRAWHKNTDADKKLLVKALTSTTQKGHPPPPVQRRQAHEASLSEPTEEPSDDATSYEAHAAASAPKPPPGPPNAAPQSKCDASFPGDPRWMAAKPKAKPTATREGNTVSFAPRDLGRLADNVDLHLSAYRSRQTTLPRSRRPGPDDGADFP